MKKLYILMLTALLGGALANAQSPLEGYNAPTYTGGIGNVGNIMTFSTSGALEDLNNVAIPKEPGGKIAQELLVAPGSKVDLTIKINTWWGQFVTFCDANESKEMTRLILCGNSGKGGFEDKTNGVTVYVEDNTSKVSEGTLPSFTVPASAEEGTVYLLRMMFIGGTDNVTTYDGSYAEVVYIDATNATISGMSDDRVYILDDNPDASTDSDDNDYYEYDAIVNGEVGTIMTTDDNYDVGLYTDVSYDENDYVDDMQPVENDYDYEDFVAYVIVGEAVEYESGVITIGNEDIVLADSYTIFYNDDGDAETWTASRLEREFGSDFDGIIYVFEDDDDQAVEIYVEGDGSGSTSSGSGGSGSTSSRIVVTSDTVENDNYDYELTVTKRNSSSALTLDEALDAIEDYFDDENLTVVERTIVDGAYVYTVENSRGFSYTYGYEFDETADNNEVTIYVNGEAVDVADGTTLGELAETYGNWRLVELQLTFVN